MKIVSALVGLAALGGVACSSVGASAMPLAASGEVPRSPYVEQTAYVCNAWGHCWNRPAYGYDHPHYWGGWGWHRWHPHYWGGWGWHHWYPHYWGGWG